MRGVNGVLVLVLYACGGDTEPATPSIPLVPQAMTIVSGNGQQGTTAEILAEPFVVRVTGSGGTGIANVRVWWTITSGTGELGVPAGFTHTAADGVTSMTFRPTRPGPAAVIARVDGGLPGSPATFTVDVLGPQVVTIRFGPLFDCTDNDPSRFQVPEGGIAAGALVEWEYMGWVHPACSARIRSVKVPPGASTFDSGILAPGQRFGLVLGVAGEYEFEDVLNGGKGTIQVR
jgi:hypothetical protein